MRPPTQAQRFEIPHEQEDVRHNRWRLPILFGIAILGAATLGGAVALLRPKPPAVKVVGFEVDPQGRDSITVRCVRCEVGTQLALAGSSATVKDGTATLTTAKPLEVGRNELDIQIIAPDGEENAATIRIPVAFRVKSDLSGRSESSPYAQVLVTVPPNAQVLVDGAEVPVQSGIADYRIDLTPRAAGEQPKTTQLALDFDVEVRGKKLQKRTQAHVRTGVTPLVVDSPAPGHVLGGKQLSVQGRSIPFAQITIESPSAEPVRLTADAQGRFARTIPPPKAGAVIVLRAVGKQLVTRSVPIPVTAALRELPPASPFGDLTTGARVTLTGKVIENRTSAGSTTTLIEVQQGCTTTPCLARIVYGEVKGFRPGRTVTASGEIQKTRPVTLRATQIR